MHSHNCVEIVFHPTGSGISQLSSGKKIKFNAGDLLIYMKGEMHNQKMEEDGMDNCLHFEVKNNSLAKKLANIQILISVRSRRILMDIADISHWQEDGPENAKDLRLTALLQEIVWEAELKENYKKLNRTINFATEASRILSLELEEPPLISDIAKRIGISSEYLRHIFKNHFGIGIKEFSLNKRIEKAKELLLHSPMRLKEVADSCGFANERIFCTTFKKRCGLTPGQFIHKNMNK
ncbi:MAG TPA: helix-turn-helix transcriptional regulator [Victivallales bacterium]|nr:helix-turn-helix transcriptional regulator [Victivallales bacterium]HPO89985.1 helix-turn-helix transcriptional regulator [Victivallales bacterium]HRR06567.1 helix-turn-helix transcriptional regulator [Victivallales bacterium]HRR29028.1 helix-turn-helix transcriptional regulator [Victivallales bacterium]